MTPRIIYIGAFVFIAQSILFFASPVAAEPLPQESATTDDFASAFERLLDYNRLNDETAIAWFSENRSISVPQLIEILKSGSSKQIRVAIKTLAKVGEGSESEVQALFPFLKSTDPVTIICAAEALGKLGKNSQEGIDALLALLGSDDISIGIAAVSALKDIGPPAVPKLLDTLSHDDNLELRLRSAQVLKARRDMREHIASVLAPIICDREEDMAVRQACTNVMSANFDSNWVEVTPCIVSELENPTDATAFEWALRNLTFTSAPPDFKLEIYRENLASSVAGVREIAASGISKMNSGVDSAAADIVEMLTHESDNSARRAAIEALGATGVAGADGAPLLRSLLEDTKDSADKRTIMAALVAVDPVSEATFTALVNEVDSADPWASMDACMALIKHSMGLELALDYILEIATEVYRRDNSTEILEIMVKTAIDRQFEHDPSPAAIKAMARYIDSDVIRVKQFAIEQLADFGEMARTVSERIAIELDSEILDIKVAAIKAIGEIGTDNDSMGEKITSIGRDGPFVVQLESTRCLGKIASPEPAVIDWLWSCVDSSSKELQLAGLKSLSSVLSKSIWFSPPTPVNQGYLLQLVQEEDSDVRASALAVLVNFQSACPIVAPLLPDLFADRSASIREEACYFAGACLDPSAIPEGALIQCLLDPEASVRRAAMEALKSQTARTVEIATRLRETLESTASMDDKQRDAVYAGLVSLVESRLNQIQDASDEELSELSAVLTAVLNISVGTGYDNPGSENAIERNLNHITKELLARTEVSWFSSFINNPWTRTTACVFAVWGFAITIVCICWLVSPLSSLRCLTALKPYSIPFRAAPAIGVHKLLLLELFAYSDRTLNSWTRKSKARVQRESQEWMESSRSYVPIPVCIDGRWVTRPGIVDFATITCLDRFLVAISGEGGVGKTTLARCLCAWANDDGPGTALFRHPILPVCVNFPAAKAGDNSSLVGIIQGHVQALLAANEDLDAVFFEKLLRSRRIMVVLDDYSDVDLEKIAGSDPAIPGFCINALIITSRQTQSLGGVHCTRVQIDPIKSTHLPHFLEDYIGQTYGQTIFTASELIEAGHVLDGLVNNESVPALFARLYAEMMVGSRNEDRELKNLNSLLDIILQ